MKNKVIILSTRAGDWEGLYIDGLLTLEARSVTDLKTLRMIQEKYEFTPLDIVQKELGDTDSNEVEAFGCMPEVISDFRRKY
jgi:hypothetical protein